MSKKYEYVLNEGESITCDECNKVAANEWRVNDYHAICEECYFNYHAIAFCGDHLVAITECNCVSEEASK